MTVARGASIQGAQERIGTSGTRAGCVGLGRTRSAGRSAERRKRDRAARFEPAEAFSIPMLVGHRPSGTRDAGSPLRWVFRRIVGQRRPQAVLEAWRGSRVASGSSRRRRDQRGRSVSGRAERGRRFRVRAARQPAQAEARRGRFGVRGPGIEVGRRRGRNWPGSGRLGASRNAAATAPAIRAAGAGVRLRRDPGLSPSRQCGRRDRHQCNEGGRRECRALGLAGSRAIGDPERSGHGAVGSVGKNESGRP